MNEEKDLLERLASVEVQVKDIKDVKQKLDSLYNLIMEMKLENASLKSDYATKTECAMCRKDLDKRLEKTNDDNRKVFWAVFGTGVVFTFWLLEQLLHITLKIGG